MAGFSRSHVRVCSFFSLEDRARLCNSNKGLKVRALNRRSLVIRSKGLAKREKNARPSHAVYHSVPVLVIGFQPPGECGVEAVSRCSSKGLQRVKTNTFYRWNQSGIDTHVGSPILGFFSFTKTTEICMSILPRRASYLTIISGMYGDTGLAQA